MKNSTQPCVLVLSRQQLVHYCFCRMSMCWKMKIITALQKKMFRFLARILSKTKATLTTHSIYLYLQKTDACKIVHKFLFFDIFTLNMRTSQYFFLTLSVKIYFFTHGLVLVSYNFVITDQIFI